MHIYRDSFSKFCTLETPDQYTNNTCHSGISTSHVSAYPGAPICIEKNPYSKLFAPAEGSVYNNLLPRKSCIPLPAFLSRASDHPTAPSFRLASARLQRLLLSVWVNVDICVQFAAF